MQESPESTRAERQAIVKHRMIVAIRAMRELSRVERDVFLALVHIWQFGGLWPKHETIGHEAGYSERHVRTALTRLRLRGLLTWEQRRYAGNQTSNVYRFTRAFWAIVRGDDCRPQVAPAAAGSRHSAPANSGSLNAASSKREGEPARETPPPVMVQEQGESDAATELRAVFAEERAAVYPLDLEHGTMREDRERAAVAQLDGLASEAVAWAAANNAPPVDRQRARRELVRLMVRLWLGHAGSITEEAPQGTLRARGHKLGLLAGDVGRFGRAALDAWQRANRPKRPELPPLTGRDRPPVIGGLTFRVPAYVGRPAA